MFFPCTVLLYDSTAATPTLKLSIALLSISCGIHLIPFLMMSSLVCGLFSQTLSFKHPSENSQERAGVDILRIGWPRVIGLMQSESVPWGVMPEVFKCSVREMRWVWRNEAPPQTREDIIRKGIRWISQEMLNRVMDNFNVGVAAVLSYSSGVYGTNIILISEKVL